MLQYIMLNVYMYVIINHLHDVVKYKYVPSNEYSTRLMTPGDKYRAVL